MDQSAMSILVLPSSLCVCMCVCVSAKGSAVKGKNLLP